jgi:hypothetical protein
MHGRTSLFKGKFTAQVQENAPVPGTLHLRDRPVKIEDEPDVKSWGDYMPEFPASARILRFGVFELDLHSAEIKKRGIRVKLQGQPFLLLVTLLKKQGDLVTPRRTSFHPVAGRHLYRFRSQPWHCAQQTSGSPWRLRHQSALRGDPA